MIKEKKNFITVTQLKKSSRDKSGREVTRKCFTKVMRETFLIAQPINSMSQPSQTVTDTHWGLNFDSFILLHYNSHVSVSFPRNLLSEVNVIHFLIICNSIPNGTYRFPDRMIRFVFPPHMKIVSSRGVAFVSQRFHIFTKVLLGFLRWHDCHSEKIYTSLVQYGGVPSFGIQVPWILHS